MASRAPIGVQQKMVFHRLRHPETRKYLHMSGEGFTDKKADGWLGNATHLAALRKKNPDAVACLVVKP